MPTPASPMNRAASASEPRASSATSAPTSTNDAPAARYRSAAIGIERVHADRLAGARAPPRTCGARRPPRPGASAARARPSTPRGRTARRRRRRRRPPRRSRLRHPRPPPSRSGRTATRDRRRSRGSRRRGSSARSARARCRLRACRGAGSAPRRPPRRASSADETIGTRRFCAPRSSTCLIVTTSPIGTRTTGVTGYAATACSCASTDSSPFGECSMSMSIQSMPEPAQISATSG